MKEMSELQVFNKVYADYYMRFRYFAQTYVRNWDIAEDITTEAFIAYWENRSNVSSNCNIPAYIMTGIKNKCLNHLEHNRIKISTFDKLQNHTLWELNMRISTLEACNPEELFSEEIQEIINKTLDSLPEKTFEIFMLSRYKNKSHKEIAESLGITTKGVEFHITKALAKLRTNLKDYLCCIFLFFFS